MRPRILVVPVVLVALATAPAAADATCLNQCEAALMGDQCAPQTSVEQGQPVGFWVSCQTCCSPPGGPLKCDKADAYGLGFKVILAAGGAAAGTVSPSAIGCPGKDGQALVFIGEGGQPLTIGAYQLIQDGMILVEFQVVAKAQVDAGGIDDDAGGVDAGPLDSGSGGADAPADAADPEDAGAAGDVGAAVDVGSAEDAGTTADVGSAEDAGAADLGATDAGPSSAPQPASSSDGGCSAARSPHDGSALVFAALAMMLLLVRRERRSAN